MFAMSAEMDSAWSNYKGAEGISLLLDHCLMGEPDVFLEGDPIGT